MKNIIYIELCNFTDYPLGGNLSFALHLTTAMKGDIDLAGCRTDNSLEEGKWHNVEISGSNYNFYNVKNVNVTYSKPVIPARVKDYFRLKKHINKILSHKEYDIIIIQAPELLFALPGMYLPKVYLISPGVGNPLSISRYRFARHFAFLYDKLYFHFASKVNIILPAADSNAINEYKSRSKGLLDGVRIVQFPTRYDASIFCPRDKNIARAALGLPYDAKIVITTGRLNWFKGWKLMIDAFKIFSSKHKDALLIFLGKGEDEPRINEYVKEKGLSDKVCLEGVRPLDIVAEYLNAADLFIMGSMTEGWSTSLVEAIACAKPCVVTNFSSASDLVISGGNGYVLNERDENLFADEMENSLNIHSNILEEYARKACTMSVQCMRSQLNDILHFE